jgi:hypothetical protein
VPATHSDHDVLMVRAQLHRAHSGARATNGDE